MASDGQLSIGAAVMGASQPQAHLAATPVMQPSLFNSPQLATGALGPLDTPTLRSVLHGLEPPVRLRGSPALLLLLCLLLPCSPIHPPGSVGALAAGAHMLVS